MSELFYVIWFSHLAAGIASLSGAVRDFVCALLTVLVLSVVHEYRKL